MVSTGGGSAGPGEILREASRLKSAEVMELEGEMQDEDAATDDHIEGVIGLAGAPKHDFMGR